MTELNSIAAWCELTEQAEKMPEDERPAAEFHINLWHFSDSKKQSFFDIGIKPTDPDGLEQIKLFLPFQISRGEIVDLGPKFKEVSIAQGIFNEPLSCKVSENNKCIELSDGNTIYCGVHQFSSDDGRIDCDELVLAQQASGTMVTITRQALSSLSEQSTNGAPGYFRLRFTPSDTKARPFITVIKPADKVWNSGFEQIEYIDCRINEARTLPQSVEAAFRAAKHGVAKTNEIVFLAVVPVVSAVTSSHDQWHKSRLLEHPIWRGYVPFELSEGLVVYHWKKVFKTLEPKRFPSFSVFVKMQTRKSGGLIISFYLLLAFLLGVIGSLTASAVQYLLSGSGN